MRHRKFSKLTRRSFISGAAAVAGSAIGGNAFARESFWEQFARNSSLRVNNSSENNSTVLAAIDSIEPMVSLDTAYNLELALRKYETLATMGGWPEPTREMFGLSGGSRSDSVRDLKKILIATGDLPEDTRVNDGFDSKTDLAVRLFQARHGLIISGNVDEETWYAMAVPVERRIAQLRINMQRVATLAPQMPESGVLVNIPAALIEVTQGATVYNRHTAVVGRIDRQTPILTSRIHQINFNPYWTVPKSIIRRDLITYMNDDPEYLTNYNIRIFDGSGGELNPWDIDWSTDEAVNYTFRQEPGAENSMGHVKINFHNTHAVYLHDTPAKSLFGENRRFHSSGCVRVESVNELVAFVLQNNGGWDVNSVEAVFQSGERLDVDVANPVPIRTTYVSAWANRDGVVSFRDDIYEFDAQGIVDFSA